MERQFSLSPRLALGPMTLLLVLLMAAPAVAQDSPAFPSSEGYGEPQEQATDDTPRQRTPLPGDEPPPQEEEEEEPQPDPRDEHYERLQREHEELQRQYEDLQRRQRAQEQQQQIQEQQPSPPPRQPDPPPAAPEPDPEPTPEPAPQPQEAPEQQQAPLTQSSSEGSSSAQRNDDAYSPDHARSALLRRSVYDQGRWSLGIDGIFSMTTSRIELLNENEPASDSTQFLRINPSVTIGILDRLHLGLVTGFVSRRLAREGEDSATERAYALQPVLQYYFPFSPRLAGFLQGAAGYYRGSSSRFISDQDEFGQIIGEEDTRTRGLILTTDLGVGYRLSEGMQLRFGLSFNALWGRENVEALNSRLSTSTYNLGTNAGIRYTF